MKDWNQLENQLRSWIPCRPSAKVRARLFPQTAAGDQDLPAPAAWHWLAPAMAVLLLTMVVSNRISPNLHSWGAPQTASMMATAALSNPQLAGYYAATPQNDHNTYTATFEWTNDSRSLTSAAPLFDTNSLRPNE